MTKLSVDTHFEKGLNSKREISDLIAGKRHLEPSRLPGWLTDAFNLLLAAAVGGACAWIAFKWLV